jgi:hypothetical protein
VKYAGYKYKKKPLQGWTNRLVAYNKIIEKIIKTEPENPIR